MHTLYQDCALRKTDDMEIDDVNAARCVGQLAADLIVMGSSRGREDSAGGGHSHEGGLLTSGTTKKKRHIGSAKHSALCSIRLQVMRGATIERLAIKAI